MAERVRNCDTSAVTSDWHDAGKHQACADTSEASWSSRGDLSGLLGGVRVE
jgi:hypothetical protein